MYNLYTSTVTQKGQATIPAPLRKRLGIKAGDKLIFDEKDQEIIIKNHAKLVEELAGSLKTDIKWDKKKAYATVGEMLAKHINEQTHR